MGYYSTGSAYQTLAEHWNGRRWAIVATPNNSPTQDNGLLGATCVSGSDCWAAGYYNDSNGDGQTLAEHWNGHTWAIVATANPLSTPSHGSTVLAGIACASTSDCWAAGYDNGGTTAQTLTEHWNGQQWSIVTSPDSSSGQVNYLLGVTCTSGSDCWAVGAYYTGPTTALTLIEQWNGSAWAIVASSSPNGFFSELHGVTCASTSECWAAGEAISLTTGSTPISQTLIEYWNGSAWAAVTSPNNSAGENNFLNAVACSSASDCWTTGGYNTSSTGWPLAEHWDGNTWAIVATPNTSATQLYSLTGVTCTSASSCWSTGNDWQAVPPRPSPSTGMGRRGAWWPRPTPAIRATSSSA